jgi:hypothetical protein
MADAPDLGSGGGNSVRVRLPPLAPQAVISIPDSSFGKMVYPFQKTIFLLSLNGSVFLSGIPAEAMFPRIVSLLNGG